VNKLIIKNLSFILYIVLDYDEANFILDMKLKGQMYDNMTDEDGRPLPKPASNIGERQMAARAKRMQIKLITVGQATPEPAGPGNMNYKTEIFIYVLLCFEFILLFINLHVNIWMLVHFDLSLLINRLHFIDN